jgi:iron complex transport system substrate-binding protein
MLSTRQSIGLAQRPGWDRIAALRERRVCAFEAEPWDVLSRPGPRLGEAAELMAACLAGAAEPAARAR